MIKKYISILVFAISIFSFSIAQYPYYMGNPLKIKTNEHLVAEFWGDGTNELYRTEIPNEWGKESAVILNRFIEREYYRNDGYTMASLNSNHNIVKILDKSGLEKYSTLHFKHIENDYSFYQVAIKIIKPNQESVLIDFEGEAILEEQGNDKYMKIAIPNLEVGDIIDYYHYLEIKVPVGTQNSFSFEPTYMLFSGEDPILNYTLNLVAGPSALINAKLSGLPPMKREVFAKGKQTFNKYSIKLENIEEYNSDKTWFYPYRALPNLRFQVFFSPSNGTNASIDNLCGYRPYQEKKSEQKVIKYLNKMVKPEEVDKAFYSRFKSYLGSINKSIKNISQKDLLDEMYNFYKAYYVISDYEYNNDEKSSTQWEFIRRTSHVLRTAKVNFNIAIGFSKKYSHIDEFVLANEITPLLKVGDTYLNNPNAFTHIGEIPELLQNTEMFVFDASNGTLTKDKFGSTTNEDNGIEVSIKVKLNEADMSAAIIERDLTIKGSSKSYYQYNLVNLYDYVKTSNNIYNIKSRIESSKNKNKGDVSGEMKELIDEENQAIKDFQLKDINDDFDIEIDELDHFKIVQLGNTHSKSKFSYEDKFMLPNFSKKVAKNYLVPIGMVIGSQVELEEEERTRTHEISMSTPRSFKHKITFDIPTGYELAEIDELNKNVVNETGKFTSKAEIEEDKLIIYVNKTYNNYSEPSQNWEKMLLFLDAANDFRNEKILLRKVN